MARFNNDIIASNNYRDIKGYCEKHAILYLTTSDILYCAFAKKVMTEAEIDYFLYLNLSGTTPSKIPFKTLGEIISSAPNVSNAF